MDKFMFSRKQRRNIGRLSWLILFAIVALPIWFLTDNHFLSGIIITIWGPFVYFINPFILRGLGIWR